ncbi:glutamic acid-rich protein-like [Lineus longissimus]|uniref:glutamic acid-rich protein-like n=1 Tax=Lineus longissimus TaxID=88925 RepID=UPI00315CA615
MSTKMDADSTMSDSKLKDKTSKRKKPSPKKHGSSKKVRKTKSKTKKKSKKDDYDSDSDYSDLDLSKDVKPIGAYIRDREDMIEQMFKAVKGPTLKGMIPDILKKVEISDLKKLCLEHLEVMSKKRIRKILNGQDPETISSSGTEDESSDENMQIQDNNVGSQNIDDDGAAEHEEGSDKESTAESVACSTHAADSTSDLRPERADAELHEEFEKDFDDATSHQSSTSRSEILSDFGQEEVAQEEQEEVVNVPEHTEPVKVKKTKLVKIPKPIRTEEVEEGEFSDTEYEEVTDDYESEIESGAEADQEVDGVEKDGAMSDVEHDKGPGDEASEDDVQGDEKVESDAEVQSDRESATETQSVVAESEHEAKDVIQSDAEEVESEVEKLPSEAEAMESEVEEVVQNESGMAEVEEEETAEEEMETEEQNSEKEHTKVEEGNTVQSREEEEVERVIIQEDGTLDDEDNDEQKGSRDEVMEVEEDSDDVRVIEIEKSAGEEEDIVEEDEEEEEEEVDEFEASLGKLGQELKESGVDVLTRNQLEILELEMRARAIKAMLKATEQREKGFIAKKKSAK